MPFPTIATPSNAYHRPSSFSDAYARPSGGLYQTLGAITNASLQIKDFVSTDSRRRNQSNNASEVSVKFDMMQAALIEAELMDTLTGGDIAFLFKMADAAAIPGAAAVTEGWVLLNSTQVGTPKLTLDYSGDPSKDAVIHVEITGSMLNSEKAAAVKASIDDDDFEATGGSGTLKTIGTYSAAKNGGLPTNSHIKPCGISTVTLAYTGGAAQTLGGVTDVKCTLTFDGNLGSRRCLQTNRLDIDIEYDAMETDAANLVNLANWVNSEIDVVITTMAGLIITLTNQVGIDTAFTADADYSKTRMIHVKHTGSVLKTAFDAIVSGA